MHGGWSKGLTKETSPLVRKISDTMKARKLDNFKEWRDRMKRLGKVKSTYPALKKSGDLAELIGTTLGDGHIYKHDRCDSLRIVGDGRKMGFIYRSAQLIESVFHKTATIRKVKRQNTMTVTIYEKNIAKRLGVPHGSRHDLDYVVPKWILRSKAHTIRFLRGLYEAEGSECHHAPTSTHKLIFTNRNRHLLELVAHLVRKCGFTVCVSGYTVQVSRKDEVQKLSNLIQFRSY